VTLPNPAEPLSSIVTGGDLGTAGGGAAMTNLPVV